MSTLHMSASQVASALKRKPRICGIARKEDRTYNGRLFYSKSEMLYAFGLDIQKSQGAIYSWTPQVRLPIRVNGVFICDVVVDFGIQDTADSAMRFVEIKGFSTDVFRLKKKLLLACYPDIAYEVIQV